MTSRLRFRGVGCAMAAVLAPTAVASSPTSPHMSLAAALQPDAPGAQAEEVPAKKRAGGEIALSINADLPIGANLQRFEMSHGLNSITLNFTYRWFPAGVRDDTLLGRLQPYVAAVRAWRSRMWRRP